LILVDDLRKIDFQAISNNQSALPVCAKQRQKLYALTGGRNPAKLARYLDEYRKVMKGLKEGFD
jgi:hypothetical protein